MIKTIFFLAVVFFLAGLLLNGGLPVSDGPAMFTYTIGEPGPILARYDISPLLGIVAVAIFLKWMMRR